MKRRPEMKTQSPERKERIMELIRQRHHFAIIGTKLEEYISDHDNPDFNDFSNQIDLANLPDSVISSLQDIVKYFQDNKQRVAETAEILISEYGIDFSSPEKAGKQLFKQEQMYNPKGKLQFSNEGDYFLLVTDSGRDYTDLVVDWEVVNGKKVPRSGGTYHKNYILILDWGPQFIINEDDDIGLQAPTIIINGADSSPERIQNVLTHERQHAINSFFRKENPTSQDKIKDEVLAYIRQGDGATICEQLDTELYDKLFEDLSETEVEKIFKKLESVEETIKKLKNKLEYIAYDVDYLPLIVYHLYDVPLERIPTRLELVFQFLHKRLEPFFEDEEIFMAGMGQSISNLEHDYSDDFNKQKIALNKQCEKAEKTLETALFAAFFSVDEKELQELFAKYKKEKEKFYELFDDLPEPDEEMNWDAK